eukprot:TRINITY_DN654_c0_g1_i1.p7 TRINITY_DN654_c0_g1~~TRINITY_DN654_c0_g1_i1.p7  ORF type:complete len:106 (-),score=16.02 TRINITY_DN654_c0_g1_i1:43-360(-)
MIEAEKDPSNKDKVIVPQAPNEARAMKLLCGLYIARKKEITGEEFTWYRNLARNAVMKYQKQILDEIDYAIFLKKPKETAFCIKSQTQQIGESFLTMQLLINGDV